MPRPPPKQPAPPQATAGGSSEDAWVNDNQWAMGGSLIANAGASSTRPTGVGGRSQRLLREGKLTREQLHAEWRAAEMHSVESSNT